MSCGELNTIASLPRIEATCWRIKRSERNLRSQSIILFRDAVNHASMESDEVIDLLEEFGAFDEDTNTQDDHGRGASNRAIQRMYRRGWRAISDGTPCTIYSRFRLIRIPEPTVKIRCQPNYCAASA